MPYVIITCNTGQKFVEQNVFQKGQVAKLAPGENFRLYGNKKLIIE